MSEFSVSSGCDRSGCHRQMFCLAVSSELPWLRRAVWEITRHTRPAAFWRVDLQTAAHQLSAVIHDVKTQATPQLTLLGNSNAVIRYAQNHLLSHPLQFNHNFSCLSVLVGVNNCLASDAKEVRCGQVIANMK